MYTKSIQKIRYKYNLTKKIIHYENFLVHNHLAIVSKEILARFLYVTRISSYKRGNRKRSETGGFQSHQTRLMSSEKCTKKENI